MSRYTIAALHPHRTCVVGYDPPLGTFFAQVYEYRGPQRRQRLLRWVGTDLHEISTVPALAHAIEETAVIPADIWQQLETDSRTPGFRPNLGTYLIQHLREEQRS